MFANHFCKISGTTCGGAAKVSGTDFYMHVLCLLRLRQIVRSVRRMATRFGGTKLSAMWRTSPHQLCLTFKRQQVIIGM